MASTLSFLDTTPMATENRSYLDEGWKEALEHYFQDFMALCWQEAHGQTHKSLENHW